MSKRRSARIFDIDDPDQAQYLGAPVGAGGAKQANFMPIPVPQTRSSPWRGAIGVFDVQAAALGHRRVQGAKERSLDLLHRITATKYISAVHLAVGKLAGVVELLEVIAQTPLQRPNQIFFCIFHTILPLLVLFEGCLRLQAAFRRQRLLGISNRCLEIGNTRFVF